MDVSQEQVFAAVGRLTVENGVLRSQNAALAAENAALQSEVTRLVREAQAAAASPAPESTGDAAVQAERAEVGA